MLSTITVSKQYTMYYVHSIHVGSYSCPVCRSAIFNLYCTVQYCSTVVLCTSCMNSTSIIDSWYRTGTAGRMYGTALPYRTCTTTRYWYGTAVPDYLIYHLEYCTVPVYLVYFTVLVVAVASKGWYGCKHSNTVSTTAVLVRRILQYSVHRYYNYSIDCTDRAHMMISSFTLPAGSFDPNRGPCEYNY